MKLNPKWAILFCALWLASAFLGRTASASNSPFSVDVWDSEDGLPQNSIISMAQTRDGYLWLGTLDGLVRFDGQRGKPFLVLDESNTPGLKSSRIVYLFEDSARRLWIGTENAGIAVMENGKVTSPPELSQEGAFRKLSAACEDTQGNVWLYCANGELWRYSNGRYSPFYYNKGAVVSRPLVAEKGGPVWIGTDSDLCLIAQGSSSALLALPCQEEFSVTNLNFMVASQRGGHWRLGNNRIQKWSTNGMELDLGPYSWNPKFRVSTACEDKAGNLIVGTLGSGVFWFNPEGKVSNLLTNGDLANRLVLSLLMDREGALWVGTDGGGLIRVKKKMFTTVNGTEGRVVRTVAEDHEGGVWIGYNGGGMDYCKDGAVQFSAGSPMNASVHAILVDAQKGLWASFFSAGLFQYQRDGFRPTAGHQYMSREISAIFQDRAGRVWAGTPTGLALWENNQWKVFSGREGMASDNVRAIAEDSQGNLWIGTAGGGISRLQNGRFTSFQKKDGLPSNDITFLHVDKQDVLWIGTHGGGLARFANDKVTCYDMSDGLISNRIRYLLEDDQNNLWLGSNVGLMRIPKQSLNDFALGKITSLNVRSFGERDGLPSSECSGGSQPGPCKTQDGKLWFPTIKGLACVNPKELSLNTNPPPVMIESVLVDGQENAEAALSQQLRIPAGKERLEIHYTSLNLAAPEQARFKYRLEGHEKDWIEAGNSRVARYSKLPPGDYKFQVTACNEDGVWNQAGSSFAFFVQPPFYQTWWFLSVTTVCLLGFVAGGVHYVSTQKLQRQLASMRQHEALEKERARIARDIHDQLGANLTQVALLGELVEADKDSPTDVAEHGQQISQAARDVSRVLDEIVWTVNPQNDTLEGLVNYVCKYAQEYLAVAELRYRLEVPPEVPAWNISPEVRHNVFLAAKEAITNIVKHAKATAVTLRLRLEPSTFTFEIEDNGVGLAGMDKERAKTRNGLRNQRKRMEDIGGSFTMSPGSEGGTLVRLSAPSRNAT